MSSSLAIGRRLRFPAYAGVPPPGRATVKESYNKLSVRDQVVIRCEVEDLDTTGSAIVYLGVDANPDCWLRSGHLIGNEDQGGDYTEQPRPGNLPLLV